MRNLIFYGLAAVLASWLAWSLIASPRIELAETKLEHAEQLSAERLQVINGLSGQLSKALILEQQNRETLAQIAQQSRAHNQALEELKRNDKTIFDYLREPVPAELGRLYQRPETADPSRYRAAQDVPVDTVPASSTSSATNK